MVMHSKHPTGGGGATAATTAATASTSRSGSSGSTMITTWVIRFIVADLVVLLLSVAYCHHHWHTDTITSSQQQQQGSTLAQGLRLDGETKGGGAGSGRGRTVSKNPSIRSKDPEPQLRILTLLTTHGDRAAFAKANREALEGRGDGYDTLMFVTSDEDDRDVAGAVDYKYGLAHNHRLLGAITEAYRRHKGEFDWVAIGDDDTVFLYNRATAFLRQIDHTQPVSFGSVDGIDPDIGRARPNAKCFSPKEKQSTGPYPTYLADKGCCRDFTRPCNAPPFPSTANTAKNSKRLKPTWLKTDEDQEPLKHELDRYWTAEYGKGGLFWPYGGSGMFLSAGLLEAVEQGGSGGGGGDRGKKSGRGGWERCTEMFGIGYDTDIQLAMCLRAHGLTTSSYAGGFDRDCETADPDEIQDRVAANCQTLGIHLGIRHLVDDKFYTADAFRDAADAVHREDAKWTSSKGPYMAQNCPKAFGAISMRGVFHTVW